MNIQEEYRKLTLLSRTKEGWDEIEKSWMEAAAPWRESKVWVDEVDGGDRSVGFAIVRISGKWKYEIGKKGEDHEQATRRLDSRQKVEEKKRCLPIQEGRITKVSGWDHKFVYLMKILVLSNKLVEIEAEILKHRIGLPLNYLYLAHLARSAQ